MRHWPDAFPLPIGPGFGLTAHDQFLRHDMEVGPSRPRRITRARRDRVQAVWVMTPSEFEAFRVWFEDGSWSLAGDSDDLTHWLKIRSVWTAGQAFSPSGVLVGRLTESATTGTHQAELKLAETSGAATIRIDATLRAAGRSRARVGLLGRDGVSRWIDVDLATASVTATEGVAAGVVSDRGNGWLRVQASLNAGVGAALPVAWFGLLDPAGASSYAGTANLGVELCEVNVRVNGSAIYLPTDSLGAARGAGGGPAWSMIPVFTGGPVIPVECRFEQTFNTEVKPGLHTQVSASLEVRHA